MGQEAHSPSSKLAPKVMRNSHQQTRPNSQPSNLQGTMRQRFRGHKGRLQKGPPSQYSSNERQGAGFCNQRRALGLGQGGSGCMLLRPLGSGAIDGPVVEPEPVDEFGNPYLRALSMLPARWQPLDPPPPIRNEQPPQGFMLKAVKQGPHRDTSASSSCARLSHPEGRSDIWRFDQSKEQRAGSAFASVGGEGTPVTGPALRPGRPSTAEVSSPSSPPTHGGGSGGGGRAGASVGHCGSARDSGQDSLRVPRRGISRASSVGSRGEDGTSPSHTPQIRARVRTRSNAREESQTETRSEAEAEARSSTSNCPGIMPSGWNICLAYSRSLHRKPPKREIKLLRSCFRGRPPVLFFEYEPRCGAPPRDNARVLQEQDLHEQGFHTLPKMYFQHDKTKDVHEYNAVLNTMRHGGLYKTGVHHRGKACLHWGIHPQPETLRTYHPFERANHFPGSWHLGRKDRLWQNIHRMKRKWPHEFNIMPVSFVIPDYYNAWVSARENLPSAIWIYKPNNMSCGRGIRLLSSNIDPALDKKMSQKSGVIQRYIDRPLLVNGFKFDLRLYVMVTSFDPLKVYLNAEGLVRIATERYKASEDNLHHRTMHLTNYSVNKHSEAYVKNLDNGNHSPTLHSRSVASVALSVDIDSGDEDGCGLEQEDVAEEEEARGGAAEEEDDGNDEDGKKEQEETGGGGGTQAYKWGLDDLREYLASTGQDYDVMMAHIEDLIIKTLVATEPAIVNTWHQGANYSTRGTAAQHFAQLGPNQTCFELFGFDVMVDADLKPWLLEVNVFPSLSSSSPFDKRVKTVLIADALTLVGFQPFDYELLERSMKEEQNKRLLGLCQKHCPTVSRSHNIHTVSSASLRSLGEAEWQLILDACDEDMRRGFFSRIYPKRGFTERYAAFFQNPRYSNLVLARWLQEGGEDCFQPEAMASLPAWLPPRICCAPC